jgi:hypothetical protein
MSKKTDQQDEFWTHRQELFTGTFRYFRNQPKPVYGRFHLSEEQYDQDQFSSLSTTIVPLTHRHGTRTYIMFQPYVLVPNMTFTVGLYPKPKQFADREPSIGEVISSDMEREREQQLGSGQAWYYPTDRILVVWECFLDEFFRGEALGTDENMHSLWTSVEQWLLRQFPQTHQIVTPWSDPAFETPTYHAFLRGRGYRKVRGHPAFGKPVQRRRGRP